MRIVAVLLAVATSLILVKSAMAQPLVYPNAELMGFDKPYNGNNPALNAFPDENEEFFEQYDQDANQRPEKDDQRGAGIEHVAVAACGDTLLMVGVGSYNTYRINGDGDRVKVLDPGDNDLQTIAIPARITSTGLEYGAARYVFPLLDDSDRQRDGMKPMVACLDEAAGVFVVEANSPKNNNNRCRNWGAVFEVGNDEESGMPYVTQLTEEQPFLANNNDDCSDTEEGALLVTATGPDDWRVNFTGSCNGNGRDVAWVTSFDVSRDPSSGEYEFISKLGEEDYKEQVSQGQIERFRAYTGELPNGKLLVIGTEGDNQPPRDGISATIVDAASLEIEATTLIAEKYTRNGDEYLSTMPHAAKIGEDTFIVSYQTRTGRRRRGDKGATTLNVGVLTADVASGEIDWIVPPSTSVIPGFSATHHTVCQADYGEVAAGTDPAAVFWSTSFQGGSNARVSIVTYNDSTMALELRETTVIPNLRHDNALVSNYYGNNPGNQGKNSQYCAVVSNPDYGSVQASAFEPDVAQFVVFPGAERRLIDPDTGLFSPVLALTSALVPVAYDSPAPPPVEDPEPPEEEEEAFEAPVEPPRPVDTEPVDASPEPSPEPEEQGATPPASGSGETFESEPADIEVGGCSSTRGTTGFWLAALALLAWGLRRRPRGDSPVRARGFR